VDEGEHPNCLAADFVDKTIIPMRDKLACARYFSWASELGPIGETGGSGAEKRVHPCGCTRIIGRDVVPYADAVFVLLPASK
jgi:hypothetical protein